MQSLGRRQSPHCRGRHASASAVTLICCATQPRAANLMQSTNPNRSTWRFTKPLLLFSDIDDTMLGSYEEADDATLRFRNLWTSAPTTHPRSLIYNTGRSVVSCVDVLECRPVMARPDMLICGVGTRIYTPSPMSPGQWCEDTLWTQHLGQHWDIAIVRDVLHKLIAHYGEDRLRFMDDKELNEHKQTLHCDPQILNELVETLDQQLTALDIPPLLVANDGGQLGANPCVILNDQMNSCAGVLDVLPARAGKGNALEWVRRQLGGSYGACVAAGDGFNDMQALEDPRWSAIVVGNAVPSLRTWAQGVNTSMPSDDHPAVSADNGMPKRVVLTQAPAAEGLLEGLMRLGFIQSHDA